MASPPLHILQGRLSPPLGDQIQSFPADNWEQEFEQAQLVGIEGIEWLYDRGGRTQNPIATDSGRSQIKKLSDQYGVVVQSLCADWFRDYPLFRVEGQARTKRVEELEWLISTAADCGIRRIVLPFVDPSSLQQPGDLDALVQLMRTLTPQLERCKVELDMETDLAPTCVASLLDEMRHPLTSINYDSGDSATMGFNPQEEFDAYGDRIGNVHLKDRVRGGVTVPLGQGSADLSCVLELLRTREWKRPLVLQVARGDSGDELAWAKANVHYVRELWIGTLSPEAARL